MTKAKILTAMAIAAAVLGLSPARADSIVLYGNVQQPPKAWLDGETPKGFAVEAAVEVLKRAGYDVTVTLLPFARAMEKTTEGGVMTGVFLSAERAKIYDYSTPLVSEDVVVAVAKGKEFSVRQGRRLCRKENRSSGHFLLR